MSLTPYFQSLIDKVESSESITNAGKNKDGFFLPTRTLLLRHLQKLRDLNAKPFARPMLKDSWEFVVEHLPPEWLVLTPEQKQELKAMLK